MNGDGKVDLIGSLRNTGALSIWTNNGTGNFEKASSPAVGGAPVSLVAADLNGNGTVDLCCVNYTLHKILVLTNDGWGAFSPSPSPVGAAAPIALAGADLNRDGQVDLVSVDDYLNQLCVLTNDGTGRFALASSTGIEQDVKSVATGDLNGDGSADLATAHWSLNSICILTNDGTGHFSITSTQHVGLGTSSIVIGDFNGDGKNDLVAGDYGWLGPGQTLSVFTNDGTGSFGLAAEPKVGVGPYAIAQMDVNNDGEQDVITANRPDNTLSVLINTAKFPPPRLNIAGSNQWIVVSWPRAWSDWTLQWTAEVDSTNWFSTGGASNNGTNKSITRPRSANNQFFRLMAP